MIFRSRPARRLAVCVASALVSASPRLAHAQGDAFASSEHGTLTAAGLSISPGISAAQQRAALVYADRIVAMLRTMPIFTDLTGHNASISRSVIPASPTWETGRAFTVLVTANVADLVWKNDGSGKRYTDNGPGVRVEIAVNAVPCAPRGLEGPTVDGGAPFSDAAENGARVTGNFHGRPIYDGACVFFTNRPVEPLLPVTKERYLNVEILKLKARASKNATAEKADGPTPYASQAKAAAAQSPPQTDCRQIYDMVKPSSVSEAQKAMDECNGANSEMKKEWAGRQAELAKSSGTADSVLRAARANAGSGLADEIRAIEAQLAALSPAERKAQAAVVVGYGSENLSDVSDSTALPLVQPNRAFFDSTLPSAQPQVVSISFFGLQDGVVPYGWGDGSGREAERALGARIRQQLDWAGLEALVHPKP